MSILDCARVCRKVLLQELFGVPGTIPKVPPVPYRTGVGLYSQLCRARSHGDADGTTGGKGGSGYIFDDTNGQGPQVIRVRTSSGLKLK